MAGTEIAELQAAVAELRQGLRSVSDAANATIHLLAYLYMTQCLSSEDPLAAYRHTATVLLGSLGAAGPDAPAPIGDETHDALARGIRHHVGQFLLLLQAHVEAVSPKPAH